MKGMVKKMKFAKITAAALSAILVGAQIVSAEARIRAVTAMITARGLIRTASSQA